MNKRRRACKRNGLLFYTDRRAYPDSAYEYYSEYNPNGNLMHSFTLLYSAGIGINRYYEEAGQAVKEENPDAPYPFSIENLILKMRREYGLIIEKRGHAKDVSRFVYHSRPYYEVVAGIAPP